MVVTTQSAISLTFDYSNIVYTHMSFKVTCLRVVRKWLRAFIIIGRILQTPNLGEEEALGGRGWYRSKERW